MRRLRRAWARYNLPSKGVMLYAFCVMGISFSGVHFLGGLEAVQASGFMGHLAFSIVMMLSFMLPLIPWAVWQVMSDIFEDENMQ